MNCKLNITDAALAQTLGQSQFKDLDSFQKALKRAVIVDKKTIPVSMVFENEKGVANKLKFLKITETQAGLEVQVVLPNLELGENISKLVSGTVGKYSVTIPDIKTELGQANDLDTLTALWLGNYFIPDKDSIKNVIEVQIPLLLAGNWKDSNFIDSIVSDSGILEYYLKLAKDFGVPVEQSILDELSKRRAELVLSRTSTGTYQDYQIKEDLTVEPKDVVEPSNGLLFKSFVHPSTMDNPVSVAHQRLMLGLSEAQGDFRMTVVSASRNLAQPITPQGNLTYKQLNESEGLVVVLEQKVEGEWKPVYMKKSRFSKEDIFTPAELTTEISEAHVFEYQIEEDDYTSSQVYFPLPTKDREKIKKSFKENKKASYLVAKKGVGVSGNYKTFAERGVSLDKLVIPAVGELGDRGVPRLYTDKVELISIDSLTENDEIYHEILGLLEAEYDSFEQVAEVIYYINQILAVGDFTLPKYVQSYEEYMLDYVRITSKGIGFFPYKEGDKFKIESVPERVGTKKEPKIINAVRERKVSPLVKEAILLQRIHVPKDFEAPKLGIYPDRLKIVDGQLKKVDWPIEQQHEFLKEKLKTRLTQVGNKLGSVENYIFTYAENKLEGVKETLPLFKEGVLGKAEWNTFGTKLNRESEAILSLLDGEINLVSDEQMDQFEKSQVAVYSDGKIYLRSSYLTNDNIRQFILEELIHAYTAENLETQKDTFEYQELDRIRQELLKSTDEKVRYYASSMEEFVTSVTMPFMQEAILKLDSTTEYAKSDNKSILDYVSELLGVIKDKLAEFFVGTKGQVALDVVKIIFNKTTVIPQEQVPVVAETKKKRTLSSKPKFLGSFEKVSAPIQHLDMLISNLAWDMGQFAELISGELEADLVKEALLEALEEEALSPERGAYLRPYINNFDNVFKSWLSESSLVKLEEQNKTEEDKDTRFKDRTESNISSVDDGSRYARIFIKMIPKILVVEGVPVMENGEYVYARDQNGNYVPADYTSLWNSIADICQGSLDAEEMKEKLKGYKKMPEMNIFLSRLEQITGRGENAYQEVSILKGIEKSFSKILVPTILVSQKEDTYTILESGKLDSVNITNVLLDHFRLFTQSNGLETPYLDLKKTSDFFKSTLKSDIRGYTRKSLKEAMKPFGFVITPEMEAYPQIYIALSEFLSKLITKLDSAHPDTKIQATELIEFLSTEQVVDNVIYPSFKSTVQEFRNILSTYLPYSTSNMTKNAEGENQSNLHNFSSWLLNVKFMNEGKFEKVPRLQNPIAKYSLVLGRLKRGAKIYPVNISGTVNEDKGWNTMNLPTIDYLRQSFITLFQGGFKENLRAETASTSFGFKVAYNKGANVAETYLPLGTSNVRAKAKVVFKNYLKGELERIWLETNKPTDYGSRFYQNAKTGFTFFSGILPDSILESLRDVKDLNQVAKFAESLNIDNELDTYFDSEIELFKNWVLSETGYPVNAQHPMFASQLKESAKKDLQGILESYILNSTVISVEEIILFHGELGQFDKFYKRSKSNISNGTSVVISEVTGEMLRERLKGGTFSESFGVRPSYYEDASKMDSIVLEENKMGISEAQKENLTEGIVASLKLTNEFFNTPSSDEKLRERASDILDAYKNSDVSDGDGYIHPDAYRLLLWGTDSWSVDMEEGYQYLSLKYKKSKGFTLSERELNLMAQVEERIKKEGYYFQFPKLKFQYRGTAVQNSTNTQVELLDKFALTPLFPDLVKGKPAEKLFEEMSKQGIAYGKFPTGTKLGTFTPDKLEDIEKGFNSRHTIDTIYLKEQVKTPSYLKIENLMGSQIRKLLLSNLSLDGKFMESMTKDITDWIGGQRELAEEAKTSLMAKLGNQTSDGFELNVNNLVELILEELESRDLPESLVSIFENFSTQKLEEALSPQLVETLIYSLLKNRVVKAKFPGGQLVQVSAALYDRDKFEFYRVKDGKVLPADCAVTLSGDFLNLLKLPEIDKTLSDDDKLEALNKLLMDDSFREKYSKELTLVAYRIPTQGMNSQDVLMVKEFLPPWMGNTIIPPPQIVTKSGTDFDYDKMSVIFPSLESNGRITKDARDKYLDEKYEKLYKELQAQIEVVKNDSFSKLLSIIANKSGFDIDENIYDSVKSDLVKKGQLMSKEEFIETAKRRVFKKSRYNKVLQAGVGVILNPANFHRLITPNSDALIKGSVERVLSYIYPGVGKVNEEPTKSKVFSTASHLRKWKATKIKDLLGIGAVANTFYTLMQTVNLKLNPTININGVTFDFKVPLLTEEEQKLVNIANPFIIDGTLTELDKLEIINQFINITVDAASNDIAGYTNMIKENTGFVLFQIMLGVPLDRILKLIHQPVVYKYHQMLEYHIASGLDRSDATVLVFEDLLGIEPTALNKRGDRYNKSRETVWTEIKNIGSPEVLTLKNPIPKSALSGYKVTETDRQILVYYLTGLAQAEAIRKVQSFNNADTTTEPSFKMSAIKEDSLYEIMEDGFVDVDSALEIHNNSVISHLNVHKEFEQISSPAFRVKNEPEFVKFVLGMARKIYSHKDKFVRYFDNDFLLYVVQNFTNFDIEEIKTLSNGSLMTRWEEIKTKHNLQETMLANKLISSHLQDLVNPMLFMGLDNDTVTYNRIAQDIRELYQSEETRQFAKDLIKLGFFQTGYNQSPLYMLKAFPEELVKEVIQDSFTQFENLDIDTKKAHYNTFFNAFLRNRVLEFGKYFKEDYDWIPRAQATFDKRTFRQMNYRNEKQIRNVVRVPVEKELEYFNFYEGDIKPEPNTVFVFGSNPVGINGNPSKGTGGAALVAHQKFGVEKGEKMDNKLSKSGKAYGLTTVTYPGQKLSMPPAQIISGIQKLYETARQMSDKQFKIAYRNTTNKSLNGYTGLDMIEMFNQAGPTPENIVFSKEWVDTGILNSKTFENPIHPQLGNKTQSGNVIIDGVEGNEPVRGTNVSLSKKNIFTVTPIQSADKKAVVKASVSTQYIGFGEGIDNSSTELYRKQAGEYANTGNYTSEDVIFVSIGGVRGEKVVRKEQQDKTIREALKAIELGATLITDNKSYVENSDYNEGEKRLAKSLEEKGYIYLEQTIDGQLLGIWRSPAEDSNFKIEDITLDFKKYIQSKIKELSNKEKEIFNKGYQQELDKSAYDANQKGLSNTEYTIKDLINDVRKNEPEYLKLEEERQLLQTINVISTSIDVEGVNKDILPESENIKRFKKLIDKIEEYNNTYGSNLLQSSKNIVESDKGSTDDFLSLANIFGSSKNVTIPDQVSDKNIVVPDNSSPTNMVIFEDENNKYLMNDGQQASYNKLMNFVRERLNTSERLSGMTKPFTNPLSKPFSGIIPVEMWENMIGLQGPGGTGKTTLIRKVIEDIQAERKLKNRYNPLPVQYLGPTHNAVTVMQESLGIDSEATSREVRTIQSFLNRNLGPNSDKLEPNQKKSEVMLLSNVEYYRKVNSGFEDAVDSFSIIVVDESSLVSEETIADFILRMQESFKTPIFIFMGDYRQLGPVDSKADTGIISATLFADPEKFTALTQVQRTKDVFFHRLFSSIGDQITHQREQIVKGEKPDATKWELYNELTKESTKDMLVVTENQIDAVIEDYVELLHLKDNPYEAMWVHYNAVGNPVTIALANRIRSTYLKKTGKEFDLDKVNVGDYVMFKENFQMSTHKGEYKGEKLSTGTVKPSSRLKVLDITHTQGPMSSYDKELGKLFPNAVLDFQTTIVWNKQDRIRVIKTVSGATLEMGPYEASTKTRLVTVTDVNGKKHSVDVFYGKIKELQSKFDGLNKSFDTMFVPSYIGSSHTVQGMGVKLVIAGEYNILKNGPVISQNSLQSSLYTTLTRTSGKLVVIKPNNSTIKNNQNVFEWADVGLSKYFNDEEISTILSNFAAKHSKSSLQAALYIKEGLEKDEATVLEKLKTCYL